MPLMDKLFGKKELTEEEKKQVMKDQKKAINSSKRMVEREIKNIERMEKKNLTEMKKLAEKGQHGPAKVLAKSIANGRAQMTNMYTMSAQLTNVQ